MISTDEKPLPRVTIAVLETPVPGHQGEPSAKKPATATDTPQPPPQPAVRRQTILELSARYAARVGNNPSTPEEIIGYDQNGLPE